MEDEILTDHSQPQIGAAGGGGGDAHGNNGRPSSPKVKIGGHHVIESVRGALSSGESESPPARSPKKKKTPKKSSPLLEDTPGRENWKLKRDGASAAAAAPPGGGGGGGLFGRHKSLAVGESGILSLLNGPWIKDHKLYSDQPERDSLNGPPSLVDHEPDPSPGVGAGKASRRNVSSKMRGGRSNGFLGLLSNRNSDMLQHTESFCYLWVILSSLYGKTLIILMLAFCLIEVMDNSVKLLTLQGIYLMYLYVGSIAVIICIYVWVLIDSCASLHDSPASMTTTIMADAEMGSLPVSRFGSLKRAHISRAKTSGTSFYLRVGALAFGLGTLVFNGLEMAMHSMMEGSCLNDVVFVHPILHGLFTFLQMHFLFVNSQVLVEKFGLIARFGFMHLAATNLALWVRLVIWESGIEWTYFVYLAQTEGGLQPRDRASSPFETGIPTPLQLRGFPKSMSLQRHIRDVGYAAYNGSWSNVAIYRPVSDNHISQVVALHQCLNTNSLGQLWTSSMPFLYPFIVQFSLIAAGVTYIMGQNVGKDRMRHLKPSSSSSGNLKKNLINSSNGNGGLSNGKSCLSHGVDSRLGDENVDCGGASKGLFLGLLCLVTVIVIIIIFLVVKEDVDFPAETLFWLTSGTLAGILSISSVMTVLGLIQVRKLSHTGKTPSALDNLLSGITVAGVQLYSIFGLVVGASGFAAAPVHSVDQRTHAMLLAVSLLQLIQAGAQSTLIGEALRRGSITRHQLLTKPGRQVITFLLFSNAALWAFDSFITQSWLTQELQLRFMGLLAWGVVSRISLPLLVFYRFHSGVLLLEVWQRAYRSTRLDPHN